MDTRLMIAEVTGQEILTKDHVSLRLNLSALYQIEDPAKAEDALKNIADYVYRELQLALRRAVGTRTLDTLLADKTALNSQIGLDVREQLQSVAKEMLNHSAKELLMLITCRCKPQGVARRKDLGVVDEIPEAYKDIDVVMDNQRVLVDIEHTLKQLICVKG